MIDQSKFSNQQRIELAQIIVVVIRDADTTTNNDDDDEKDDDTTIDSFDVNSSQVDNSIDWKSNDIDFFDSKYENSTHINDSIVNVERHVFYRDVYVFIDKLKEMTSLREENKLRIVISQCLRDTALIWHSMKLSDFEKKLFRNRVMLSNWYNVLIIKFKKRISQILQKLQRVRYTMTDVRNERNSHFYAQKIFRHVRFAKLSSIFNQIIIT